MAKIESAIREAIARGARKQIRQVTSPLRREVRRLRQVVRRLRADVSAMREVALQWQRAARARPWQPEVSEQESKAARLSARLIQKLRARLGLSQTRVARLVGVSAGAVVQWERGRSAPSGQNRKALLALRKLGRRDVRRILAVMPNPSSDGRAAARRHRRRRPKKRK